MDQSFGSQVPSRKDKWDEMENFGETMRSALMGFYGRVVKDLKQKELIPLKILFFIHSSTLLVLYPYLTIHMRELGINVEETAVMSAVTPIIAVIIPPLAGMLADKVGNFKTLLSVFSAIGGLSSLFLLLVPVGRVTVTYPSDVLMTLGCHSDGFFLSISEDNPCNASLKSNSEITGRIESCGFYCEIESNYQNIPEILLSASDSDAFSLSTDSEEIQPIISDVVPEVGENIYSSQISMQDPLNQTGIPNLFLNPVENAIKYELTVEYSNGRIEYCNFNLTKKDRVSPEIVKKYLEDRTMKNNKNYRTAIRRVSQNHYYFPVNMENDECFREYDEVESGTDFLVSSSTFSRMKRQPSAGLFGELFNSWPKKPINFTVSALSNSSTFLINSGFKSDCSLTGRLPGGSAIAYNTNAQEIKFPKCEPRCLLTSNRTAVCKTLHKEVEFDSALTFWTYLAVRVFIGIIGGITFAMFEGAVIAVLREHKADYGLQRVYGAIGGMISSPVSGWLIDYVSKGKGYRDFRPAFYLYAGLKVLGAFLMLMINLEFKPGAHAVIVDVISVLKKVEVIALMISCFVLGIAWGYIESFLFWFLQDMGGSNSLMGMTYTVGGLAGIPLLALSGPIIDKIGHANVIFIGFIFYAIRLLGYSLITNPWDSLYFEAMESITTSLSFTAAVTYAAKLSTNTTDSSVQGLLGGLYFGVGKGAGSLVGGFLMKTFKTRLTFQIFAVFTFFMGCVYFLFNQFYMRHRQEEGNDIIKKEPKESNNLTLSVITSDKPRDAPEAENNNRSGGVDNPAFENDKGIKL